MHVADKNFEAERIENRKTSLTYVGTKSSDNLSNITQALRVRGGRSEQAFFPSPMG